VTLERLYTPWRLAYVTGAAKSSDCVFCAALASEDADPLIVLRGSTCFVILNLFPYNNGHLMVVPNRHIATLVDARPDELDEMMELTRLSEMGLREAFNPEGINVGINLGKAAGAGILEHLHIHLVPRWTGDTNFMTIIGQTRVLPQELPATADRLRPIFERLANGGTGDNGSQHGATEATK
jgi:ATP adenylyltransferase